MLEHFFGSKTRVKLLTLFFRYPERSFYVREMARLIDIQLNAVRRELANLERLGILQVVQNDGAERGEQKFYCLSVDHFLADDLASLIAKARIVEYKDYFNRIVAEGGDVHELVVSGFFMGDDEAPIDLMIVGNVYAAPVETIIAEAEAAIGRPLRYTFITSNELSERQDLGDVFVRSVFAHKHIIVYRKPAPSSGAES